MYHGILNHNFIKKFITTNNGDGVAYRWTHGATDYHLGDGLLVYSLVQFFQSKTCVCLGSGGGFIPRIMSQARQDLYSDGTFGGKSNKYEFGDIGTTIVVDDCNGFNGEVDWNDEDSFLREMFHPMFIKKTTETAYYNYFIKRDIKIDYLHIDADHTFDGVKKDFELYSKIMNKDGIITIHDTDKEYIDNFVEEYGHEGDDLTGPGEFIKTIDKRSFEVFNFFNHGKHKDKPSSTGLTIVRKK
ncbi:hypothetical protein HOE22_09610 [Candidatus Woesearchaeota archaeon]|nr:hypothetical protein [Candidatus Woesearchaeota archaeon]MBT7558356.1 hypothetical protein [Candidatus Woesearchaeota archaeon]